LGPCPAKPTKQKCPKDIRFLQSFYLPAPPVLTLDNATTSSVPADSFIKLSYFSGSIKLYFCGSSHFLA
jgi:hypothetical protein